MVKARARMVGLALIRCFASCRNTVDRQAQRYPQLKISAWPVSWGPVSFDAIRRCTYLVCEAHDPHFCERDMAEWPHPSTLSKVHSHL